MKRRRGICAILLLLAAGCEPAAGQRLVSVSVGLPEQVAAPVRNAEGVTLAGRFSGSQAEIVEIERESAIPRAKVAAEGVVTSLQLATLAVGPDSSRTLAVVTSCPGGYGDQPETEEFKQCLTPPAMESVELDGEGRPVGPQTRLPSGLPEGTLFASGETWVWEGWDPDNRAVYADGTWQRIAAVEPVSSPVLSRCTTRRDLWVLHGESGPRAVTGLESASANPEPNLSLFVYPLQRQAEAQWTQVQMAALRDADFAELACGDQEAFVRVGDALFSTDAPARPVAGIRAGIDELRPNPAGRPVLFLDDGTCLIVGAGGRSPVGRQPQASATSERASVCDSVPWPRGRGFVGLSQDQLGNVSVHNW